MKKVIDSARLHKRLRVILGHIKAIDKMLDDNIPCDNILTHINAVKKAVHKAGQAILERHLQNCVKDGIKHGNADKTVASFSKAIEQFSRL
ncbi:MAG: metal-sensing transcriptional repressor [Spirochaetaceae bacterium]|jgi:DNA-binding FrmR family transcriptional regulator|nr:metal-sensing transcriptional repressor [Spirochaetaceae bacterium]